MKDLIDKLSSYNIFNYFFPGIIFVIILDRLTTYHLLQDNILIGAFLYYFIGLVISRVGSLLLEPILKRISFLKYAEYSKFIKAEKEDDKIGILLEVNNMYRTLSSVFLLLILAELVEATVNRFLVSNETVVFVLIVFLLLLFLFSYKKQTSFIKRRIELTK